MTHPKAGAPAPFSSAGTVQRPPRYVGQDASSLSDAALQARIEELTAAWQQAYARFQEHGNPCDREQACQLLHVRDDALRERLRRSDAREGYFMAAGNAARLAVRASL